jgi:hypothetical protein
VERPAGNDAAAVSTPDEPFGSWRQLHDHALSLSPHYEIFDGDNIRFPYAYQGESFQIFLRHSRRSSGTSWLLLGVRTAPANPAVTKMLTETLHTVGALCLVGDYLCVDHNLPLRGLRPSQLRRAMHALCDSARAFAKQLTAPTAQGVGYLDHLAE